VWSYTSTPLVPLHGVVLKLSTGTNLSLPVCVVSIKLLFILYTCCVIDFLGRTDRKFSFEVFKGIIRIGSLLVDLFVI
jgi:hypothetical protein